MWKTWLPARATTTALRSFPSPHPPPTSRASAIPHSPLEAVKSMATVKLIWVLEEGEQQGVTWTQARLREGEQGWRAGSLGPPAAAGRVWSFHLESWDVRPASAPPPTHKGLLWASQEPGGVTLFEDNRCSVWASDHDQLFAPQTLPLGPLRP